MDLKSLSTYYKLSLLSCIALLIVQFIVVLVNGSDVFKVIQDLVLSLFILHVVMGATMISTFLYEIQHKEWLVELNYMIGIGTIAAVGGSIASILFIINTDPMYYVPVIITASGIFMFGHSKIKTETRNFA